MLRRDFLRRTASGLAATWVASKTPRAAAMAATLDQIPSAGGKYRASDDVVLGRTGIRTSRLAMGTGTIGGGGASNQTRMGTDPFVRLLLDGYHDNGLRFFDTADSYGSHPYVASALKQLPRDRVTVMTKTDTRDPEGVRQDLERFRRELGIETIDIVLIHCTTEPDWTTRYRGVMDVLSEAKQKGIIRAHGVSCHTIAALRDAANHADWVDIDLVRLNPVGAHMDADAQTVIDTVRKMKQAGTGVVGMKILGQGALRQRPSEGIRFALNSGVLDAFTIGAESRQEQNDLTHRIAAA